MEDARKIAKEWIEAWNTHDLELILSHYSDDIEMSSPFISRIAGDGSGKIRGKAALRDYWAKAFEVFPDLKFELHGYFASVDSLVITYKSVGGRNAAELLVFDESMKVIKAAGHYDRI